MPRLMKAPKATFTKNHQKGLSLVELMVGITVGLFVVAAASTLMASQLTDNRKLLVETQLQQDLRSSLDIITRQIRRAGATTLPLTEASLATDAGMGGQYNLYANLTPTVSGVAAAQIDFAFFRTADEQGPFKFKVENGTIKTWVGDAWQELTDSNTVNVTTFDITPTNVTSETLPCPKLCPIDASHTSPHTDCWPKVVVREFSIAIEASSRADANVRRSISSQVRLRNDWLKFSNPANPICPA